MAGNIIKRQAVRALILTPENECLLVKAVDPASGSHLWVTPGGGIEPGENAQRCLARELFEETGLENPGTGMEIWRRESSFTWENRPYLQSERFFLIRAARFEAHPAKLQAGPERRAFAGLRWWSLDEIANSNERFAPRKLAEFLEALIREGPPSHPILIDR